MTNTKNSQKNWPLILVDTLLLLAGYCLHVAFLPFIFFGMLFTDSPSDPTLMLRYGKLLLLGMLVINVAATVGVVVLLRRRKSAWSIACSLAPVILSPFTVLWLLQ